MSPSSSTFPSDDTHATMQSNVDCVTMVILIPQRKSRAFNHRFCGVAEIAVMMIAAGGKALKIHMHCSSWCQACPAMSTLRGALWETKWGDRRGVMLKLQKHMGLQFMDMLPILMRTLWQTREICLVNRHKTLYCLGGHVIQLQCWRFMFWLYCIQMCW